MTVGVWRTLAELEDPELKKLAASLPHTVLHSRADSTTKKYARAFQRWKEWAEPRREVAVYPVQEVHFALYLQHLGDTTKSKAAVDEAVNAINWTHRLSGLPLVSESPFVRAVQAGLQKALAKPRVRKEPVTSDMLRSLVDSLSPNPSLSDVRLVASAVLAYAAFLRFDELAKLRCWDVLIEKDKMSIHIASSKTDQFRQGDTILVSRTGTATCPVAMLERYIDMAEIDLAAETHLFRGIVHTKNKERLRASGSVSYTRMRELFLGKLAELGYNPKQYGLHSLRAGGASAAANAGVPDRLFKRHGRWRSETAKDGYVRDATASRMAVSKSLGL